MHPRNPEFNAADIVRFFCNNLSVTERRGVLVFFLFFWPAFILPIYTDFVIERFIELVGIIDPNRKKRIKRILKIAGRFIRSWASKHWLKLLPGPLRKEVMHCIKKTLDGEIGI